MNFKMKLAALVALSALVSAPAFAATDIDVTGNAIAADVNGLAQTELAGPGAVLSADGNVAFINQEGAANLAYIDQAGATNFASIVQVGDAAIGVVYQVGDANRAAIYQH